MDNQLKELNVIFCGGSGCADRMSDNIVARFEKELAARNLTDKVRVGRAGCLGLCNLGPIMIINPGYTIYADVKEEDMVEVIETHLQAGRPISRLRVSDDHLFNRFFRIFGDVDFFSRQLRITLRNCGVIDPESIDDYLAVRGYEALASVLEKADSTYVVDEIKAAGLRGRGGAGFPTGVKWEFTAKEKADKKYVICNADEGDPGAFMDRSAIEGDPHSLLEGMTIGGYAVGATKGFIYIRAEYPLAIARLEKALKASREEGFLGENILGSGFSFDIELRLGAGAFVCGEETALIHSIEGKRGTPSPKPPYPAVSGLWGYPTVINNVETWSNVPVIMLEGAKWFSSIGTEDSKGTKVFALAGSINNAGLVEVPMGTTLREIVYDVGGGIPEGGEFKAVQIGGPSGGCLPSPYLDTKIDYKSLVDAGAMMGSGGMIIMDQNTCMVNVSRFFLEFTQNESCGKCTPCREGTRRMLDILNKITEGKGEEKDIEKLERLAKTIKSASLCGLGQSAPNPVLSTLANFREEYEEHVRDHKCRAGVCTALLTYTVTDKCIGCTACARVCPVGAISGSAKQLHVIDDATCIRCGICVEKCRFDAIVRN
jgi:NADH:ubiquinone oxidoreductase subunit F (NADH-binding)/(2Fe-2S) ferredoxin/NAD-dependent dihydropyrimidine dehydrogenase PreA subunit